MSSGVVVNFKKSCGLWCGSWKHRTDSPLGISWKSESLTVLGCTITTRNTVASLETIVLRGSATPSPAYPARGRAGHWTRGRTLRPRRSRDTVKLIFTYKDKNVLADLKPYGIENGTLR
ncbi:hypothetical protein LAZ67_7002211 [Cordylochernes scorpioides]|uniref:Uncharacterized protein n=1 Tax=Cordylochernes scorpioides TaxID=51811 RepID=A0ABY6KMX3_9ARAC|nr:hypothetical protein LAZ67_7002211 [Cordylochernes scorpioides]